MSKKVALIYPGKGLRYSAHEPLHLGYIAAYLERAGVDVRIFDELAGQDIEECLDDYKPDIAGITSTTPIIPSAYRIAKLCKDRGIMTVMGGVHASVMTEEVAQHADIVVKGEGEIAMLDIVQGKFHGNIVSRPYIKELDTIPPPARHLLQMDYYMGARDRIEEVLLQFIPPKTRMATMHTSRGCPFSCIFCHNNWKGIPYRYNSAERVIADVKNLMKKYGIGAIWFNDDHWFIIKERVAKICQMMIDEQLNLLWIANSRVDALNPEMLKLAYKAGCRSIAFGFESGSNRILKVLNKRVTVEQNLEAVRMCQDAGIEPRGTVMFGNPTETIEDIRMTQDFVRKSKLKGVGIMITTPYPGTVIWEWCKEHRMFPEHYTYDDLDCDHSIIPCCDTIPPKVVKQMQTETRAVMVASDPIRLMRLIFKGLIPLKELVRPLRHPVGAFRALFEISKRIVSRAGA